MYYYAGAINIICFLKIVWCFFCVFVFPWLKKISISGKKHPEVPTNVSTVPVPLVC